MNAMLLGNFQPTRVFVVAFLIDFSLRIFVNPKFSPSLILGQWMVRKQEPEYVGAPQKRFAWAIGFAMASLMLYLIVIKGVIGPINMLVCGTCLLLLFFESSFGICVGCKLYDMLSKTRSNFALATCAASIRPLAQVAHGCRGLCWPRSWGLFSLWRAGCTVILHHSRSFRAQGPLLRHKTPLKRSAAKCLNLPKKSATNSNGNCTTDVSKRSICVLVV